MSERPSRLESPITMPSDEPRGSSEIASGQYRYQKDARRLQAEHTGSPDHFLSLAEEQECAQIIEAADIAQNGIAALLQTDAKRAHVEKERYIPLLEAGQRAKDKLIESNLRFAAYYARASVNIVPPAKRKDPSTETESDSLVDETARDTQFRGRPGAFGDITRLRSRYADLEDRIQVANEGLIEAAATFRPRLTDKGKSASFISHAKYHIHAALSKYSKTGETPGWHVNANQVTQLYQARKHPDSVTPETLERLDQMDEGRQAVSLEEVPLHVIASEETEEGKISEPLTLADIVPASGVTPTDRAAGILSNLRSQKIEEALATLSEREAGVIRLRFGLTDGIPQTLDEIGNMYGVTRERIRQIENKTMSKLRHPSRSEGLAEFLDIEADDWNVADTLLPTSVVPGIPNIRTTQAIAREGARDDEMGSETNGEPQEESKESWQAYMNEVWDMQPADNMARQDFEHTARRFESLLYHAPLYPFQRSFAEDMGSAYPVSLVETIQEQLGHNLTSSHIEEFWNHHIHEYVDSLQRQLGDDFSLDRVSTLFSKLLAERMHEDDHVELLIPTELNGRLNGMGTGLQAGELMLQGDVGDFTGYQMGGMANIKVRGSVGDFAAVEASGFASLEIIGDAGHYVGGEATEAVTVYIHGSVQDYCGEGLRGIEAAIEVNGDAGENVGDNALNGLITIHGTGLSASVRSDFKGVIDGEFIERAVKETRQPPRTVSVKMGQLAVGYPEGARAAEHIAKQQPKDIDTIVAEMESAQQKVNPTLLEPTSKEIVTRTNPRLPEHLTFSQACEWFGLSAKQLNAHLTKLGYQENAELTSLDILSVMEESPSLRIETVPEDGFTPIEQVITIIGAHETPRQFRKILSENNIPTFKFRDVDGRAKYFMRNENY